ncbi:MAG: TetR/AcrR family transcriptional regulator [Brevinematales bacterium]|jgi:AcrR family transcriptional regulator
MEKNSIRAAKKYSRKNIILKAAERIFIKKGYEFSSMDEIAEVSGFTKRTIYRYFEAKEDIYFALALDTFSRLVNVFEEILKSDVSGNEKLYNAGEAYLRLFIDEPDQFLIMSRARLIHTREKESPYHQKISGLQKRMFEIFGAIIAIGRTDKSINPDIDQGLGTLFLVSSTVSIFSEMAENRNGFSEIFGIDIEQYMRYSLKMLTGSFRTINTENIK